MSSVTPAQPAPTPPPRRWGLRLLVTAIVLLVLLWAAPIFAAYSPLVGWACAQASAAVGGKVSVGSVSLGWFSPIVVTNVALHDADDQMVALIPRVEGDRSLLTLLFDPQNLGSFQLKRPKIDVTFAGDQSNIEKMLSKAMGTPAPLANEDAAPTSLPPQFRLEIVEATIDIHDADTKRKWPIGPLSGTMIAFQEAANSVQINVAGSLADGAEAGSLKAEIALHNAIGANPRAAVKARFSSFPMALADLIVRRQDPATRVTGSLQGNCSFIAARQHGKVQFEFDGELTANQFTLATPTLRERLVLERVRIPCTLELNGRTLIAQNAEIDCDFGKATLKGTVDLASDWRAALDQPGFDVAVDVNLASVAERLPRTLHLHRDLRLTSGRLTANGSSSRGENGVAWQAYVRAADLRGVRGQNTISWAEPMTLEFQARHLGKGVPLIDQLKCNAKFLDIEASSGADQFTLVARADLRQLAEPLGEFVDLDDVQLAGQAQASLQARRIDAETRQVYGEARVDKLALTWLTGRPWQEDVVTAKFDARVRFASDGKQGIDALQGQVKLGADGGTLTLTEPIADISAGWFGAISFRGDGDLSRWQKRAAAWTKLLDDWRLAGNGVIQASVRLTPQAVDATSLKVDVTNLRCSGNGLTLVEPTFNVQTAARWEAKTGAIDLAKVIVLCPTVALKADALTLESASAARGAADVTIDLARLRQWTAQPGAAPAEPIAGRAVGRLDLQATAKSINAGFNLSVTNFVYGQPASPTWREDAIKFVGYGAYDRAADVLRVEKIDVAGAEFNANAKGTIAEASTRMVVNVDGMLVYDLAKLQPQLRPLLGKDVKIVGNDSRPFKLTGPLDAKGKAELHFTDLQGEASLAWQELHALGCDVGPAQAKAVLQKGWLQLYPIDTSLNGGKLHLQPNLRLEPAPREMILLAVSVIDKAKITPEMCASGLGYAMPLLANVAEAQGSLSLNLDSGRLPLAAPATGDVKGTIILHSATVGVNPTLRELANTFKVMASTGLVKECKVPFQMTEGKVYHKDLELVFPEMTLKSSGAVGLDGSLAIVVEMPIPKRLADAARLTAAQAKQTIRIPIGGTLEHPRIDPQVASSITSVLGRSLLENELNKLLPRR